MPCATSKYTSDEEIVLIILGQIFQISIYKIGNIDLCENMSYIFIEPKNISEVKDPKNLTGHGVFVKLKLI